MRQQELRQISKSDNNMFKNDSNGSNSKINSFEGGSSIAADIAEVAIMKANIQNVILIILSRMIQLLLAQRYTCLGVKIQL